MKDFLKPAEIILIALLVALAMGIWSSVDSPIAEALRKIEPSEDQIQLENQVPRLQSVVKANEDGLASTRAKVQELELELAQQSGGLSNLVRFNPNTVQWKMGKIAASPCQTVSPLMVT